MTGVCERRLGVMTVRKAAVAQSDTTDSSTLDPIDPRRTAPVPGERAGAGPSAHQVVDVTFLGGHTIRLSDRSIRCELPPRALALLAFLLLDSAAVHGRALLATTFWPDLDERAGRRRLSQTLWTIRRRLDAEGVGDLVEVSGSGIGIAPRYTVRTDVAIFEQLLDDAEAGPGAFGEHRAAQLASALALYAGDFLAGCDDGWVGRERRRLRRRHLDGLRQQVRLLKAESDLDTALATARLVVEHEPLDEDAHCEVMRLCCLLGRPGEARRQFVECSTILESELGVAPLPSTVELLADAGGPDAVAAHGAAGPGTGALEPRSAPFVGREGERRTMLLRLVELMNGGGGAIVVEGDAGTGKSRLIGELTRNARWRGAVVLGGRHVDAVDRRPFAALAQALAAAVVGVRRGHLERAVGHRAVATAISALAAPAGGQPIAPTAEGRWHGCEALANVLLALGTTAPTIVVLEDVHRSDGDTVEVLAQLGDRLAASGVLLVVSHRPVDTDNDARLREVLDELTTTAGASRIAVGPLAPAAARQLAEWAAGGRSADAASVERLVAATGGNPLFVLETVRAVVGNGGSISDPIPVTATLAGTIEQRLATMPPPFARALGALAVASRPLYPAAIAEIAAMPHSVVLQALSTGARSGDVGEVDGQRTFDHELVRRAVEDALSDDVRRELHRRAAEVMGRNGTGTPGELARHLAAAGAWEPAAEQFVAAARHAVAVNAPRTADRLYVHAREAHRAAGLDAARSVSVLLEHEAVLDVLAERDRQEAALDELVEVVQGDDDQLDVLRRQAAFAANTGRLDDAITIALEATRRAADDDARRAATFTTLGSVYLQAGRASDAVSSLEDATRVAADDAGRAAAYNALGRARAMLQDFHGARADLAHALTLGERLDDPRIQTDALGALGIVAIECGDHDVAEQHLRRAIDLAATLGYRRGEAVSLVNLASMYAVTGRGGASVGAYARALDAFTAVRDRRGTAMVLANRAEIRRRYEVDLVDIGADARAAYRYFCEIGDARHQAMCLDTLAALHRRAGRTAHARRTLATAATLAAGSGDRWFEVHILRSTAMLELAARRFDVALTAIRSARSMATELDFAGLVPSLLVVEAQALAADGDRDGARAVALDAARRLTDHSDLAAYVAVSCAQVLLDTGDAESDVAELVVRAEVLLRRELHGLDSDQRAVARASSPHHALIARLARRVAPAFAAARLTALDPAGHGADGIDVVVTISDPDDVDLPKVDRRRTRILRITREVAEQGAVAKVTDLATLLGTSVATVKRDLAALRSAGHDVVTAASAR